MKSRLLVQRALALFILVPFLFIASYPVDAIRSFDGPSAVINTGGGHFWPYGLNYDNEWSDANAYRHV